MKLRTYLAETEMKIKDFAEILDIHYGYMSHIINNEKIPSKKLAIKIFRKTNGFVKVRDDFDDFYNSEKHCLRK